MRRKIALDAILAQHWAIQRGYLKTICDIAQGCGSDPEALEARLGQPLDNSHDVTVRDGIATIPIVGPIFPRANLLQRISGATSLDIVARDLTAALEDRDVRGIILDFESPGGVVNGVSEMASMIRAGRDAKPIIAYTGGMMASAAYWLGSAADEIVLEQSAMVGSIGVATAVFVQEQPDRDGFREIEIVSSNAPNKRPDPREDAGLQEILRELNALEAVFIETIADNRGVTAAFVAEKFARGGVRVGIDAVNNRMADRVATYEQTLAGLIETVATPQTRIFPAAAAWSKPPAGAALIVASVGGGGNSGAGGGNSGGGGGNSGAGGIAAGGSAPTTSTGAAPVSDFGGNVAAPSNPNPAAPATRPQATEEIEMDLDTLTLEQLTAARPELVAEIETAAAAAARADGAAAERTRILGIQAHGEKGHEALIAQLVADGKTTPAEAAEQILSAQRQLRDKALKALEDDDREVGPATPNLPGKSLPPIAQDPKALAREARKLIAAARRDGESLAPEDAVRRVIDGDRAAA